MTDFRVGDRVAIRRDSEYYGRDSPTNPSNKEGIVTSVDADEGDSHTIVVTWRERGSNVYRPSDLARTDWVLVEGRSMDREKWLRFLSKFNHVNDYMSGIPHRPGNGCVSINLTTKEFFYGTDYLRVRHVQTIQLSEILGG